MWGQIPKYEVFFRRRTASFGYYHYQKLRQNKDNFFILNEQTNIFLVFYQFCEVDDLVLQETENF